MNPEDIENQKSAEQKRVENSLEEMERQVWKKELKELVEDCLESVEGVKESFEALDNFKQEPYEVVEETYQRPNGSRYKIVKILERHTCKIIGERQVELKDEKK